MIALVLEGLALIFLELFDHVELLLVASDEGGAGEEFCVFGEAMCFSKDTRIVGCLFRCDALQTSMSVIEDKLYKPIEVIGVYHINWVGVIIAELLGDLTKKARR